MSLAWPALSAKVALTGSASIRIKRTGRSPRITSREASFESSTGRSRAGAVGAREVGSGPAYFCSPRRAARPPTFYGKLESAIKWLMGTTFESKDPAEKTRLAVRCANRSSQRLPHHDILRFDLVTDSDHRLLAE